MQIHESYHNRVWREPDEIDIEALREARRTPAPAPQPEAEAPAPFWTAAPAAPGVLQELPPAPVQAPPPPPPPPVPYVGEKPVDAAWLNEREQALRAVRADYEAARAAAQANVGGTGWTDAVMVTDESGSTHSASGRPTVFVPDSNAPPQVVGWDEGGPVYAAVTGRTLEFDDDAFAAHYRAQGGAALQNLARLYDTDAGTLLARHPEMWQIATQDHAINAGPAPAGRAMGDPGQLGMLDLYLADPQIAELIDTYGGKAAPAVSGLAPEQARIYGEQRYEQLTKLGTAMQAVRDDYAAQLANAQANGGPGWVTTTYEITYADEGNVWHTGEYATRSDFSVDAFTDWYIAQDGVANRAFASFYGRSHAEYATDESGVRFVSRVTFDNPSWEMGGPGSGMYHRDLVRIDPNAPPRLNDNSAIGFDLEAGWATHHSNIHQKRDWFETVVQVAIVAAAAWATGGAAATWAAGAGYGATAGAVIAGAAAGATASAVSGAMNGNLSFKGILQGALSGAITGGLLQGEIGAAVGEMAGPAGTIVFRGTVQGGINALLGGSFKDGAIAGVASGLADLAGANLNKGIEDAVKAGTMSAAEAIAARSMARIFTSAVRALGSPGDPQYAFASDLVGSVVNDGLNGTRPAPVGTAFDDDGNLMPGVVDPNASREQQMAQLAARLREQGFSDDEALRLAGTRFAPPVAMTDPFSLRADTDDATYREMLAERLGIPVEDLQDAGWGDYAARSGQVLMGFVEGAGFSILGTGEAILEIAKSPGQFINGVKMLLTSAEARAQFGQEVLNHVRADLQMLEDAWNAGDLRGVGQQLGKITVDLAQTAGGVEALTRLGISAASTGGRLLLQGADALANGMRQFGPGLFDAMGRPLMDFRALTSAQKGVVGELLGADTVQRLVPDAQRIGRVPTPGQTGIDDLYRVARPDVDFVVVEYKFGSSTLGSTADGLQMSDTWLMGSDRLTRAVGAEGALDVSRALNAGRVEKWLVHTDPLGNVTVALVDKSGKVIPQPKSALFGGGS